MIRMHCRWLLVIGLAAVPTIAIAQVPNEGQIEPLVARPDSATAVYDHSRDAPVATAVRTDTPPSIDGRPTEDVWMTAPAITDFRQTVPIEGAPITERTEIRFLYDDENIYVGAWLWDRGEVLSRLARRDAGVPDADFFVVLFDSYHDHRTAYRFATSPAAMKRDEIVSGGGGGRGSFGDTSWDPIWDVETSITDEGWFIEMRIPFSQLRYSSADVQTWGLQVERKIRRNGEDTVWSFTSRDEPGGVPRYGHLVGIEGIAQGKRLEMLPYVGARAEYTRIPRDEDVSFDNPFRSGSDYFGNFGVDLKYRLTSNLTLDATVNPDFGQVEVDPAVINLSAYETRYQEKRPFFVEGGEIFDFGGGGSAQLLYSRRIGRAPQGSVPSAAVYSEDPGATTILGALKLTSKTASGWSTGILNAVTGRETSAYVTEDGLHDEAVVEPLTNYFAGRVRRDFNEGAAAVGIIGTAVNRDLGDTGLESRLRSAGYAAGLDWGAEIFNRTWSIGGELAGSYVTGSKEAISAAQLSSARYLARPDADHLEYDPTATSLAGMTGRVGISKEAGDWRGGGSISGTTPSFEINDLGFQSDADRIRIGGDFGYDENDPGRIFRDWGIHFGSGSSWNFGGDRQSSDVNVNLNATLLNFHGFNARFSRQFEALDDRLTRGGPTTLAPAGYSGGFGIFSNSREPIQVRSNVNFSEDDAGGWSRSVNFDVNFRFRGIYELSFGPQLRRSHNAAQYVTSVDDPAATQTFGSRYVFAPLDQTTFSFDTRFNATFTPELSLELYAQPLLSSGDYGDLVELAAPRTFDFVPYAGEKEISDRDFNVRSLIGNAVLRWEWRPGSTFYLVWQQARSERLQVIPGDTQALRVGEFDFNRDARALFGVHPDNILLLKVNYWLNP